MSAVQAMHATADKFSEDVTLSEARREAELAHLTERIGRLEAQAQRDQSSIADLQAAAKASIARSNAKARKKASPEASDEESAEPEPPKPKVTVAAPDRDLVPAADTQSQLIDVLSMREWVLQQGYAKEVDLEVIHERMEKMQVSMEKLQDSGNSTDDRLAAVLQDVNGRAKLGDLRELKEDILRTVTDRMNFSGDELRRLRESMELKHQSLEEELEALRPRVGTLAQQLEKDRIPEGAGRLGGVEEQLRAQAAGDAGVAAALARAAELEAALDMLVGVHGVADRVQAIIPALAALVQGVEPPWLDRLRRNVALHSAADGVPSLVLADAAALRAAQRGPRLGPEKLAAPARRSTRRGRARRGSVGSQSSAASSCLLSEAPDLVPGAGSWERLDAAGVRCTCGATVFSSCRADVPQPCENWEALLEPNAIRHDVGVSTCVKSEMREAKLDPIFVSEAPPLVEVAPFVPLEQLHSELYDLGSLHGRCFFICASGMWW
ncbi:unnamed protein product [Prorocentrum cordatum]|nr:unnamed protein product [Polarella glacialis]